MARSSVEALDAMALERIQQLALGERDTLEEALERRVLLGGAGRNGG